MAYSNTQYLSLLYEQANIGQISGGNTQLLKVIPQILKFDGTINQNILVADFIKRDI